MNNIKYEALTPLEISSNHDILKECSQLYSEHYGRWSNLHPNENLRGRKVKLSSDRLNEWFNNDISWLYLARNEKDEIIGYAIALNCKINNRQNISWVSQLVVHKDYRNSDVAKNLLYSIWGESKNYAWGIISANPYAIRALEKATRRRCSPVYIKKYQDKVLMISKKYLPYVNDNTDYLIDNKNSMINTQFYVDHDDVPKMMQNVTDAGKPWCLGNLKEGWEWLGVTFNKQKQIKLSVKEITEMIETSDMITKQAYARMQVGPKQKWMTHTEQEVDFIVKVTNLKQGSIIYDFGCGNGRHSIELAKRGFNVVGIDYIEKNIENANKSADQINGKVKFVLADCRNYTFKEKADVIICLYDVIGSFVNESDNNLIMENICNNIKKGGIIIASVMNFELTNHIAINKFDFAVNPDVLLNLKASQTMETTGNIFDPNYLAVDEKTHVVYRKERFEQGRELPIELIVRDRRYTLKDIEKLCANYNLQLVDARFVNAKDWNESLSPTDKRAKEILFKCIKI